MPVLDNVSHTRLSTFRRCKQKYHWMYVKKYRPPSSTGQTRGSAGHRAIAEWHRNYSEHTAMSKAWIYWQEQGFTAGDDWDLIEHALQRYFAYSRDHDTFQLIAEEQMFDIEYTLPSSPVPVHFIGYMDGIIEDKKKRWVLENKFYKRVEESGMELDPQVSLYMLASYIMGYNAYGTLYNIVRVGDGPTSVKDPVVRRYVHRNPAGLNLIESEVLIQINEMLAYHQQDMVPYRNSTKDCSWDCPFYRPCVAMQDDGLEPTHLLEKLSKMDEGLNEEAIEISGASAD